MKKNDGWMNALFALVFIVAVALVGFYFFLPDWTNKNLNKGLSWAIAIGFLVYVIIFSIILVMYKVLSIESLNFNIPLALVMVVIFVSYGLPIWGRALLVFGTIMLAFPMNILITKLKYISK